MRIRAATFNMQNGQIWQESDPDSEEIDLDQTIDFIRSLDVDILFLQEVEQGHDGGFQADPPPHFTRLRKALDGYDSHFGYPPFNRDELPFGLGLAIFSRFALSRKHHQVFPAPELEFTFRGSIRHPSPRLFIEATADVSGKKLRLMNSHLQAFFMIGLTSERFRIQRDLLEQQLRAASQPALLGGDFNCAPGENLVSQFAEAGFQTAQNEQITWRRKPFVLDHLFYNAGLSLVSSEVIPTSASDHHAVVGTFDLI